MSRPADCSRAVAKRIPSSPEKEYFQDIHSLLFKIFIFQIFQILFQSLLTGHRLIHPPIPMYQICLQKRYQNTSVFPPVNTTENSLVFKIVNILRYSFRIKFYSIKLRVFQNALSYFKRIWNVPINIVAQGIFLN